MSVEMVSRVTLSSNKVVLLRSLKIKHQELAAKAASSVGADGASISTAIIMQNELLKMLVVKIDDVDVKPSSLEDLDSLFTYAEHSQLMEVIGELSGGGDSLGKPKVETVSIGQ